MSKDIYETIAERIIEEQQNIIGPLAFDQAKKVEGITLNIHEVTISGDKKQTLTRLVEQYANLFGQASVEVCKEAVHNLNIDKNQLPAILQ